MAANKNDKSKGTSLFGAAANLLQLCYNCKRLILDMARIVPASEVHDAYRKYAQQRGANLREFTARN